MNNISWNFSGERILVTGGTRGIGNEVVNKLSSAGAEVIFTYTKNVELAQSMIQAAKQKGFYLEAVQCDHTSNSDLDALIDLCKSGKKPLIKIVNNVGTDVNVPIHNMTDEQWHEVFQTNLHSTFKIIRGLTMSLVRTKGRIVNVASLAAVLGSPGQVNYCAAKAGVLGLTKALSKELGKMGVCINAVVPGLTETDMTMGISLSEKERMSKDIPLGRIGTAEEVANLIMFLLANESSYINGEAYQVDGGMV